MLGKVMLAGGAAGVAAYSKLKNMDSTEMAQAGARVSDMVGSLAEKAEKSEFLSRIRDTLEQTKAGSVVLSAADSFARGALPAVQTGAQKLFDTMSEAKAKAERGEGTFGKNMLDSARAGIAEGLRGAVSTGVEFLAEKIAPKAQTTQEATVQAEAVTERDGEYEGYDAEPGFDL